MSWENNWPLYIQRRFALGKAKYKDPASVPFAAPNGNAELDVKEVVEWFYAVLTTLDAKASALMRLNGVLIAAAAFLLGLFHRPGGSILSTTSFDAVLIIVCALLSAVSITFCFFVVNVSLALPGESHEKGQHVRIRQRDKVPRPGFQLSTACVSMGLEHLTDRFLRISHGIRMAGGPCHLFFLLRVMHHRTKERNRAPPFRETGAETTSGAF